MFPFLMNFLHCLEVLEVEKNVFIDENFHFFTPTFFPIFQDDGTKNIMKGTFYITWGFSRLRERLY